MILIVLDDTPTTYGEDATKETIENFIANVKSYINEFFTEDEITFSLKRGARSECFGNSKINSWLRTIMEGDGWMNFIHEP